MRNIVVSCGILILASVSTRWFHSSLARCAVSQRGHESGHYTRLEGLARHENHPGGRREEEGGDLEIPEDLEGDPEKRSGRG